NSFAEEQVFVWRDNHNPGTEVDLDLHWHIVAPWWARMTLRVVEQRIFDDPELVVIEGQRYQTLNPTDNLHYLSLHAGLGHQFRSLRGLMDIALLAQSGRIDWRRLRKS